ncbi:hypothetical protein [Bacillus mycoides]|uniref:hypothetical protein n=1 Tax=Bacillus mycoides TaxID=1405 RepID=UPI003D20CD7B
MDFQPQNTNLFSIIKTCSKVLEHVFIIYPAIRQAVRPPPQNAAKAKKLGGGRAARKSPIGEG